MKVIFLDMDGVLTGYGYPHANPSRSQRLDPDAVARLNRIISRSGAKVVISSSWRSHHSLDELRERLREVGFEGEVIDRTPDLPRRPYDDRCAGRAREIQTWVDAQPEPLTSFVVLDDIYLDDLAQFLVNTELTTGLLDEHVEAALAILGED